MARIKKGSYVRHAAVWVKGAAVSHIWHLDSNPVGLRVSLMEWEDHPHEAELIKGDGRTINFKVLAAGELVGPRVDVTFATAEVVLKAAREQDLDAACIIIQDAIGQTDGGVAGMFFSDLDTPAEWGTFTVSERLERLCNYVLMEKAYAGNGSN
jgi:hypothetical protein